MKRILKDERNRVKGLFLDKGFNLEKEEYSLSFGDSLLQFEKGRLRVRALSDKGVEYLEVGTSDKPERWYDIGLLKALLFENENLLAPPSMESDLHFFLDHLSEIEQMFAPANSVQTKAMLDNLIAKRAHQMFPDWY